MQILCHVSNIIQVKVSFELDIVPVSTRDVLEHNQLKYSSWLFSDFFFFFIIVGLVLK